MKKGYVYIFFSIEVDGYKIGESDNPKQRESQGETWLPRGIDVWGVYPFLSKVVAQRQEYLLHNHFSAKRINRKREWFKLNKIDLIEADQILSGGGTLSIFRRWYLKFHYFQLSIKKYYFKILT